MTELEKAAETWTKPLSDWRKSIATRSYIAGAQWALQNRYVEKVLCAACKYLLFDEQIITLGYRHDQAISAGDKYYYEQVSHNLHYFEFSASEVQGFITTKNRFVDRKEAAEVAYSAGQIASPKTELHSEDLY